MRDHPPKINCWNDLQWGRLLVTRNSTEVRFHQGPRTKWFRKQRTKIRFGQRIMETMATLDSSRLISMLIFFQFTVIFFYPLVSGECAVALSSLWLGWPDPHVHQALSWKAWDRVCLSGTRRLGHWAALCISHPRRSLSGSSLPFPMLSLGAGPSDFASLLLTEHE